VNQQTGSHHKFPETDIVGGLAMAAEHDYSSAHRKAMESEFFDNLDDAYVEPLQAHATSEARRRDLISRSGIRDQRLIDELIRLQITPESLIAVRLIPLVMVAWSDGEITEEERSSVRVEAAKLGIGEATIPGKLLDAWLKTRPRREMANAWKRYAHLLMASMSSEMCEVYISELDREMKAIARASGGKMGIGKISEEEQIVIERFTRLAHVAQEPTIRR
jgi:hypothetical protein